MATFPERRFIKRLDIMDNSAASIQSLTLWLIHQRQHYRQVVKIWYSKLLQAKGERKLTFMYLANDIVQNRIKPDSNYRREFGRIFRKAFEHIILLNYDEKMKSELFRLLRIWSERQIYDESQLKYFTLGLVLTPPANLPLKRRTDDVDNDKNKKPRVDAHGKKRNDIEVTVEVHRPCETHVNSIPQPSAGYTPKSRELINALQKLENNLAPSDEVVRQMLARIEAERMSAQIQDMINVVNNQNNQLAKEAELKNNVIDMLMDNLFFQNMSLIQTQNALKEYAAKLQELQAVQQGLKTRIENLSAFDVTRGSFLPSAGWMLNPKVWKY